MTCHVYVIEHVDSGNIKIGISQNVAQRLSDLQSAAPGLLVLKATFECADRKSAQVVEKLAHGAFWKSRVNREWFRIPAYRAAKVLVMAGVDSGDEMSNHQKRSALEIIRDENVVYFRAALALARDNKALLECTVADYLGVISDTN